MSTENGDDAFFLETKLLAPFTYLSNVRGKQFGLKIPVAFNYWLKVPTDKLRGVLETVDTLQAASLLLDDVQDSTKVRRGKPSAHCVYGVPLTINTSLHIICLVLAKTNQMNPKICDIVIKELLEAVRGQGSEIYWRDNFICPTEKEYFKMVEQKTGARFAMIVKLIQIFSDDKRNYSKLVSLLGRYFQIRDDYCNLNLKEELEEWLGDEKKDQVEYYTKNGKRSGSGISCEQNTYCEDLTEGKFIYPVIHAARTSGGEEILNIVRQRTEDINLKKHCVMLLEKIGSMQYTRDKLSELDRDIRNELDRLGGNPIMEDILDKLLSWKLRN